MRSRSWSPRSDLQLKEQDAAVETKIILGTPVSALLRNSIAAPPARRTEPTRDLLANGGTIEADFRVSPPASRKMAAAPRLRAARKRRRRPVFVDRTGKFRPRPTSPLIDRGRPRSIVEPGELDSRRNARSLDGNRDCVAAPDIGALRGRRSERGLPAKSPTPSLSSQASASPTRRSPRRAKNRRRRAGLSGGRSSPTRSPSPPRSRSRSSAARPARASPNTRR